MCRSSFAVRYQDIMYGQRSAADVRLAPYDVVYVPTTGIAEVFGSSTSTCRNSCRSAGASPICGVGQRSTSFSDTRRPDSEETDLITAT